MRYPVNKTSITTSRYCYSCFSQAGKEAGERARGRSEIYTSPLAMSSSLPPTQSEEKVEEGGDWRPQQEDQGPHEGGAPGTCVFFFDVFELPCDNDFIQVKLYDKISFTFGVLCICGTEVERRKRI